VAAERRASERERGAERQRWTGAREVGCGGGREDGGHCTGRWADGRPRGSLSLITSPHEQEEREGRRGSEGAR
jgi:hypothetical protein